MVTERLRVIGWIFAGVVGLGLGQGFAGKALRAPLGVVHKVLALVCVVLLFRAVVALREFNAPPALLAAIAVFGVAYLAAFASGIIQSIPACTGTLWLSLHRVAAGVAIIACAIAARLMAVTRG